MNIDSWIIAAPFVVGCVYIVYRLAVTSINRSARRDARRRNQAHRVR